MITREYRFGKFSLRPAQRQVLVDGKPQKLGRRGYDLLLALVERQGEVVTRDELFERVWHGRVVIDDNLKVQVMGLRALLGADAVITVPGHGYRFGLPIRRLGDRAVDFDSPPTEQRDTLIGRADDLANLLGLLKPGVLVTVAGSGGVGKTRLAIAAAERANATFGDGAAVVELASLREPHLVCSSVARQMRLPQEGASQTPEALAHALAPLSLLLVLDNCEHLLGAVSDLVTALLAHASQLAILATSQEPLGLQAEAVLRVAGLAVPPKDGSAADVAASPAAVLLAERVQALDKTFRVDDRNAEAVGSLCRRLDGIPLALELAAARVPLLGVDGVLLRLGEQMQLLSRGARDAPTRHQTLRAALQWSHALLDDTQKKVFRRVALFADSFTVETAQQVCATAADDPWQVLDALHALVDKSLVSAVPTANSGERRLRLLLTAREFALERLSEAGERDAAQVRHADAVLAIYGRALEQAFEVPMLPWLERLWPELPELRAALRWTSGPNGDPQRLVALVGVAGYFMNAAGMDREAQRWIEIARPLLDANTPPLQAARFWQAAAFRSVDPVAPIADAIDAARRAADLFGALGQTREEYRMLGIQAHHGRRVDPPLDTEALLARMRALEQPEWSSRLRSVRLRPEGVALARSGRWQEYRDHFAAEALRAEADGDELHRWACQHHISLADLALDQPQRAAEGMRPIVDRLRELGYLRWQWTRPAIHLMALIDAGATAEATVALRETLPLMRVADAIDWMPECMALWALLIGETEDAARLLGWSDAVLEASDQPWRDFHRQRTLERAEARLAERLSAERIEALRSKGRQWDGEAVMHRLLALAARQAA
jgi:predicted ATPase/DNA-binding winged helix-turn-helix (wHTH) protein